MDLKALLTFSGVFSNRGPTELDQASGAKDPDPYQPDHVTEALKKEGLVFKVPTSVAGCCESGDPRSGSGDRSRVLRSIFFCSNKLDWQSSTYQLAGCGSGRSVPAVWIGAGVSATMYQLKDVEVVWESQRPCTNLVSSRMWACGSGRSPFFQFRSLATG